MCEVEAFFKNVICKSIVAADIQRENASPKVQLLSKALAYMDGPTAVIMKDLNAELIQAQGLRVKMQRMKRACNDDWKMIATASKYDHEVQTARQQMTRLKVRCKSSAVRGAFRKLS